MLILEITTVVIAALMVMTILLQQRGSGLGDAFGGDTAVYTSRRGAEKLLYYLSIIFGISFVALTIIMLVISK